MYIMFTKKVRFQGGMSVMTCIIEHCLKVVTFGKGQDHRSHKSFAGFFFFIPMAFIYLYSIEIDQPFGLRSISVIHVTQMSRRIIRGISQDSAWTDKLGTSLDSYISMVVHHCQLVITASDVSTI